MYLYCNKLRRLSDHEDLGISPQGKHIFKCKETGEIRGLSKSKKQEIVEKRNIKKESDRKFYEENGGKVDGHTPLTLTKDQIASIKESLSNQ